MEGVEQEKKEIQDLMEDEAEKDDRKEEEVEEPEWL